MRAPGASIDFFSQHGGRIDAAGALFPAAPRPWLDLSTGISPWAWPYAPLPASVLARLPEPHEVRALEAAAAACFGVADPAQLIAIPGTDLGLRLLEPMFCGRRVAVVRPGYSGHRLAWRHSPVTELVVDALESAAQTHDVLVLANPNNPDGRLIAPERLHALAKAMAAREGVLVVDEAYVDVEPGNSLCADLGDGLIVFRSFGKFFGLSGVRLGFAVARNPHAASFRQLVGDWPVSGPAVMIGRAAYGDAAWQAAQRERLRDACTRLDALLLESGLSITGGTPLYRLARITDAAGLFRKLASRGILVRPFHDDAHLVRIGLPANRDQWGRLRAALNARSGS